MIWLLLICAGGTLGMAWLIGPAHPIFFSAAIIAGGACTMMAGVISLITSHNRLTGGE